MLFRSETLPSDSPLGESETASKQPISAPPLSTDNPSSAKTKTSAASGTSSGKAKKNSASRSAATTEAQRIALVHKAQLEAFHGRLAGIKHNVDELNHKLDDLENKS